MSIYSHTTGSSLSPFYPRSHTLRRADARAEALEQRAQVLDVELGRAVELGGQALDEQAARADRDGVAAVERAGHQPPGLTPG